jgi:UDPglucose--hexose-1-phosphate uridylyltransferase
MHRVSQLCIAPQYHTDDAMHSLELIKPDGRHLTLYSKEPINASLTAPSPFPEPQQANPHLRWHPLRGEWVTYAAYRQNRTFLPPPQYNPLAPTVDPANPTELPGGAYQIAVFDNRFPALSLAAHDPPLLSVPTAPAHGHCEVVVFTQDSAAALAGLALAHIELLLQVWADRTLRLGADPLINYVLPFENRGAEVGVTLHHPHGQIYAYPVVPPVPLRMLAQEQQYYLQHGTDLLGDMARAEAAHGDRVLYQSEHAIAFVPACARYPYEVWVMPATPAQDFAALSTLQRSELARALKTVLLKYDGLWSRAFPYLMNWYQAPTDGLAHPETRLHAQLLPPYRTRERLKYLAGTELGAGMFAMDVLPEATALELQQVHITLEDA